MVNKNHICYKLVTSYRLLITNNNEKYAMNRREFLRNSAIATSMSLGSTGSVSASPATIDKPKRQQGYLSWLEGAQPLTKNGTTWGLPWKQGSLKQGDTLCLKNSRGEKVALQSWPNAYWPDGSIKWTGHAIAANTKLGEQFTIVKETGPKVEAGIQLLEKRSYIDVSTGLMRCRIGKKGKHIIQRMEKDGKIIAQNAQLMGLRQDKAEYEPGEAPNTESFSSKIQEALVEQEGPLRAVIKINGIHRTQNKREWLPFSLRLYFYSGGDSVKLSHSFIYDGDDQTDFIRGLGLEVEVPMHDELYNRHIRIVGEDGGIWGESPQGITGLRRDPGQSVKTAQIEGKATPPLSEWDERVSSRMHWIPVWNDVSLTQLNANGFAIRKRTKAGHAWIDADQGKRAKGVAYLGGVSGGLIPTKNNWMP